MLHVIFWEPEIPGNTGAAIRLSACTGSMLHLIKPLGFDMDDAKLRRAGLDYHDLAHVTVHENLDEALDQVPGRVWAFTDTRTPCIPRWPMRTATACFSGVNPSDFPPRRWPIAAWRTSFASTWLRECALLTWPIPRRLRSTRRGDSSAFPAGDSLR